MIRTAAGSLNNRQKTMSLEVMRSHQHLKTNSTSSICTRHECLANCFYVTTAVASITINQRLLTETFSRPVACKTREYIIFKETRIELTSDVDRPGKRFVRMAATSPTRVHQSDRPKCSAIYHSLRFNNTGRGLARIAKCRNREI